MNHIQQQRYDIVSNNFRKWERSLTKKERLLYGAGLLRFYKYTPELAKKIDETPIEYIQSFVRSIPRGEVTAGELRKLTNQ